MLEITRELLERYLRATKDPGLRDITEMMDDGCSVRDILDSHIHSDCAEFRLGLCAAAERDLEEAEHLTMPLGSMGMFTADDEHGASVLVTAAKRRLADAGIDPSA